jgi:iron complex transport system ATP-binding protein
MIRAQAAEFAYGEHPVVRGVSFEARAGQLYGVLGPNGSGKTTLVRLLLGFLQPRAGKITVADRAVADYSRREFARAVAAVPQEMPVDFPFTVRELVLLGRMPHLGALGLEAQSDLDAADEAMTLCGVRELADRPIHALSGGELRRAYVARAIAQHANALVCDEPTSGLDIHHQIAVFELLRAQARAGRCVVAVVHDLNLAAAYCDRLLLLRNGSTVAEGTVEDVLTYRLVREAYDVDVYVGVNEITGARFLIPMGSR